MHRTANSNKENKEDNSWVIKDTSILMRLIMFTIVIIISLLLTNLMGDII